MRIKQNLKITLTIFYFSLKIRIFFCRYSLPFTKILSLSQQKANKRQGKMHEIIDDIQKPLSLHKSSTLRPR